MKRTMIIAAVLLSAVVFALPASAENIDSFINSNNWLEFHFEGAGSWASDCASGNCSASSGGNSVFLGAPAWTLDLAAAVELKITDAFLSGDSFSVFDDSASILTTQFVLPGLYSRDDPSLSYGSTGFSYGSVILLAGKHSLTIQTVDSPNNKGVGFFRLDSIVATPEPLSIMLLGLGLMGLGAVRRSRG